MNKEKTKERLEIIEKELANLKERRDSLKAQWETEKKLVQEIRSIKVEIDRIKNMAAEYERQGDFAKVAELRYGKLIEAQKKLEETSRQLAEAQKNQKLIKEEIEAEDVAAVVASWTGIPVQKMLETEREKLLKIEERLHKRVVGQDEAISAVANAIRRSRAGLQDPNRPLGSFIFLGSTGVGKTELARALAEFLFDDENAIVRVDMSEYMEKHSVSRLIGAPPGYVGYEEGGQLTEAIRRKPYSVVLLDEIEKAHPDVFNVLLQVLDDGRLTDGKGRIVNFKNTIIIMTSNLGSELLQEKLLDINEENRERIMAEIKPRMFELLKRTLRPEFLNRVDEIVVFQPLVKSEVKKIAALQIEALNKKLAESKMKIELTDEALDKLLESGFDKQFGARPLKRAVQKLIADPLAKSVLAGDFVEGDSIEVYVENGSLAFRKKE